MLWSHPSGHLEALTRIDQVVKWKCLWEEASVLRLRADGKGCGGDLLQYQSAWNFHIAVFAQSSMPADLLEEFPTEVQMHCALAQLRVGVPRRRRHASNLGWGALEGINRCL